MKRRWQLPARVALVAVIVGVVILVQACGGGSAGDGVTTTAATPAGSEEPRADGDIENTRGSGPGARDQALLIAGASEEFAAFLGISLEQLESELSAEGATPGSVAEAHGRTREELKTFFIKQLEANLSEAVAAESMSQEDADNLFEGFGSRIDDMIDGKVPSGGPEGGPDGQ